MSKSLKVVDIMTNNLIFHIIFLAVLLGAEEGVLHRLAVRSGDAARTAALVVALFQLVDGRHQPDLLGLRQLVGQQMFSVKGAPCGLAADHRADTGHRFVQGVCHRQVALAGRRHDGRRADGQKIRPGRLVGRRVRQACKEQKNNAFNQKQQL